MATPSTARVASRHLLMAAEKLPIMSPFYNIREICKQLLLLEDHLIHPQKRCPDCIRKHLLTAEALAEEAVSLDTRSVIDGLMLLAERIRVLWRAAHAGIDLMEVARATRVLRKQLVPTAARAKVGSLAKTSCIIAVGEFGGDRCLLKNRDRNYTPEICVYHEIRDGVEVLYALDEITDWTEGLNEFGIGVVNAALMVGRDEAEKKIVKGIGKKSKDGERVRKLLSKKTLEEAIEVACKFKGGIKGHSFVSDPEKSVSIEQTSKHDCVVKTVASNRIHVRTNHGFDHEDAGYTEGEDYVSSVTRRDKAKKVLRDVTSPTGVAPAIYGERGEDLEDPNNMVRDTDNMRTTSQMVLDLTKKQALFYIIPGQVKYLGYKRDLPEDYEAKLTLKVYEYTDIDGDGEFDVIRRKREAAARVAAKYKSKKTVKSEDGVERVVYEYSERQTAIRDREKAKRVEGLRKKLPDLRKKVKRDLTSDEPETRLTALAVALIDETYERVGNDSSAQEGHFGVTGWKKSHLSFSGKKAILKYVGKSGVDHEKEVTTPGVVTALREAVKGKKPGDRILCEGEDCLITPSKVNGYLKEFDITAKDLRGLHANEEVKRRLSEIRKNGPSLPKDREEKDKILKEEFKEALEAAAEAVGHAPSMLRSSYLVPGFEEAYLKDGKILDKLDKKASVQNVVARWLEATKSKSEKEDEQAERLVRPSPTKKPPRRDLERGNVESDEGDDPDEKRDKKDRSQNYKDSAAARDLQASDIQRTEGGKFRAERPDSDKPQYFETRDEAEAWLSEEDGDTESLPGVPEDLKDLQDPEKLKEFQSKITKKYLDMGLLEDEISPITDELKDVKDEGDLDAVKDLLDESVEKREKKKKEEKRKKDKEKADRQRVVKQEKQRMENDPTYDLDDPIPESGPPLAESDQAEAKTEAFHRAKKSLEKYSSPEMDQRDRARHLEKLDDELKELTEGDPRRIHLEGIRRGILVASALKDMDKATGIGSSMANLAKAAEKTGKLDDLLSAGFMGGSEFAGSDDQAAVRRTYASLDDSDWGELVPEDHPARKLADLLADPDGKGRFMSDDDRQRVKEHLTDLMVAETSFLDPATTRQIGKGATVAEHKAEAKKGRMKALPERSIPDVSDKAGLKSWFAEALKSLVGKATKKETPSTPVEEKPSQEPSALPEEEKPKKVERAPGDVWESGGRFYGKDQHGNISDFKTKEYAENFASGASEDRLKKALDWSFEPWKSVTLQH